jgi:hypothetical protein
LWENAIKTQWLFHTLEISDEGLYHEFMDIMKQTPSFRKQVVYVQMEYVVEDDQISWLLYASKKYPNLKEYYIEIETCGYEQEDMEALRNIYSVGYTPLLESLGPQLMSIYLPGAEFDNFEIFYKMDEHRCQIKSVVLFSNHDNTWCSALSHSNQARHIDNLAIYSVRPCTFDWVKHLEVLKSLTISFEADDFEGSDEIDISMLLNSCSKTVKSIEMNHCKYCFTGELDYSFQLEELRLDYGQAPANIDQFISNCLPNLRVLSLDGSMDSYANLILPTYHFSDVRLYLNKAGEYSNFLVKTIEDSKRLLFKAKNKQSQVFVSFRDEPIKPLDEDNFNGEPFTELVFGSVEKLIINNYEALLD